MTPTRPLDGGRCAPCRPGAAVNGRRPGRPTASPQRCLWVPDSPQWGGTVVSPVSHARAAGVADAHRRLPPDREGGAGMEQPLMPGLESGDSEDHAESGDGTPIL